MSAPFSAPPAADTASAMRASGARVTKPGLVTSPTTLTTTGWLGSGPGRAAAEDTISTGGSLADTTAGGIGGCPYCGNGRATGMAATEDLVCMLEEMGIATGVELPALIVATGMLRDVLDRPLGSHVSTAGPVEWRPAPAG